MGIFDSLTAFFNKPPSIEKQIEHSQLEIDKLEKSKTLAKLEVNKIKLESDLVELNKLKNTYKAAYPSENHKAERDRLNINISVKNEGRSLIEQLRLLEANFPIVRAILNGIKLYVCGDKGVSVEPAPTKADGVVDFELGNKFKKYWEKFTKDCLINDTKSLPTLLNEVVNSWWRDGEVFIVFIDNPSNKQKPVGLRVFSALDLPYSNIDRSDIELDAYGHPLYYNFEVNEGFRKIRIKVPASNVVHLKHVRETNQTRGVSPLACCISHLSKLNLVISNYVTTTSLQTQILGTIENVDNSLMSNADYLETPPDIIQLDESVTLLEPAPNKKINIGGQQPLLTTFRDDVTLFMQIITASIGIDVEVVTNAYNSNYSASRQAKTTAERRLKPYQTELNNAVRRIYELYIRWLLSNEADLTNILLSDYEDIYKADYQGPTQPSIDPVKDAKASSLNIKTGISSRTIEAKKIGNNIDDVTDNMSKEELMFKQKGVEKYLYQENQDIVKAFLEDENGVDLDDD